MTGLILEITGIENAVSIEFYIERDKSILLDKNELVRINDNGTRFFAFIDADRLGRGHLMCRVLFTDMEEAWKRSVTVSGFTGYSIPCMGGGNTISCGGYSVTFKRVDDLPVTQEIYYGVVHNTRSYEELTESDIKTLNHTKEFIDIPAFAVVPGDKIVIAIPERWGVRAYKDNGFGSRMPFSTSVMGANGLKKNINGITYMLYGEFMTVGGTLKTYIE